MTPILQWMGDHLGQTFVLACIALPFACVAANVITAPIRFAFKAYNRHLRSVNIRNAGWPPPHCDADGDGVEPNVETPL